MRRFIAFGPATIVLLAAVVTLFAAPSAIRQIQIARVAAQVQFANNTLEAGNLLDQLNREVKAIADAALPGTVHIRVRGRDRGSRSTGAGWFYDKEGHIVTNAHVVEGTGNISVEFADGRVREAQRIGADPMTDIAVIKVDPYPEVFPLPLGLDHSLALGDRVYAFGSPFEIRFSMSEGIVSGLGRSEAAGMLGLRNGYTNFIQTDAAMNPGNSGGPLVDVNARVVGMNTAIANAIDNGFDGGQNAGIGFAIPVETLEVVVEQLIDREEILRGYMGVNLGYLNEQARAEIERKGFFGNGVPIRHVNEGEPADLAGLQSGDIIVEIDGRETPDGDVLRSVVSVLQPGRKHVVKFWRDGEFFDTDIQLGAAIANRGSLEYIPGSNAMSIEEIREYIDRN